MEGGVQGELRSPYINALNTIVNTNAWTNIPAIVGHPSALDIFTNRFNKEFTNLNVIGFTIIKNKIVVYSVYFHFSILVGFSDADILGCIIYSERI